MLSIVTGDSVLTDYCADSDADTLIFDPPWNAMSMPAGGIERFASVLAFCDGRRAADVVGMFGPPTWVFVWDCSSSWWTPNRPLQRAKLCLWYGDLGRWCGDAFFLPKENPRRSTANTRGSYSAGDTRGTRMSDVYQRPIASLHAGSAHKHSKPIEWLEYLIACTGSAHVYDPFCGSGAAVAAAARRGVPAIGVEIDPGQAELARAMVAGDAAPVLASSRQSELPL